MSQMSLNAAISSVAVVFKSLGIIMWMQRCQIVYKANNEENRTASIDLILVTFFWILNSLHNKNAKET